MNTLPDIDSGRHYMLFVKTQTAGFYIVVNKEDAQLAVQEGMFADVNVLGDCMINYHSREQRYGENNI